MDDDDDADGGGGGVGGLAGWLVDDWLIYWLIDWLWEGRGGSIRIDDDDEDENDA